MAALLHGTLVVGVSHTLRRWTEGATYIRQEVHHVGHWPTFLAFFFIKCVCCIIMHCTALYRVVSCCLEWWISFIMTQSSSRVRSLLGRNPFAGKLQLDVRCVVDRRSQSLIISVAISSLVCTELLFIDPGVKVDGRYYRDVLPLETR